MANSSILAAFQRMWEHIAVLFNAKADTDLSNVSDDTFREKAELAGIGGSLSSDSSNTCKKIGFTADCDYIATSIDGLTAFSSAISDASDGDTIMVMPGTYTSSDTLTISKNINIVGISLPTINFNITVEGDSSIVYDTTWTNILFKSNIDTLGYYDENVLYTGGGSSFNTINCVFNGSSYFGIHGTHHNSTFKDAISVYSNCGNHSMDFYNCDFSECRKIAHSFCGECNFYSCNIYNGSNALTLMGIEFGYYYFYNSNVYNYNSSSEIGPYMTDVYGFYGCSLFGVKFNGFDLAAENLLVTLTNTQYYASVIDNKSVSDGISASSNLITANTLRYALNRTTSVGYADTNYTTYMARGTSLNSAETTPTVNGTIAWTYE